jgi:hypothetical protein
MPHCTVTLHHAPPHSNTTPCPTAHLYIYLSVCLSAYLSFYLSVYLPTYIPTYLSIYLPTYLPIYLSNHLPTYLPIYLPIYLFTYLSISLPIYLLTYLSIYIPSLGYFFLLLLSILSCVFPSSRSTCSQHYRSARCHKLSYMLQQSLLKSTSPFISTRHKQKRLISLQIECNLFSQRTAIFTPRSNHTFVLNVFQL